MTKNWWLLAGALAAVGCGGDKSIYDGLGGAANAADGGRKGDAGSKDGGKKDEDVCGAHSVVSDHAVPDMLIVLDRSSSMSANGNANRTDRWGGSAKAVSSLVTKYSTGVNFGLMTFPGNNSGGLGGLLGGNGAQCAPGAVDVPIGEDQGAAINQAISRMGPNGYTPTAATLEAAVDVIGKPQVGDQRATAAKFILLVTDGDPNCSSSFKPNGGNNEDPQAREETIAAIEKLTEAGVRTYVVGYETAGTNFVGQLDMMAAAGGTGEKTHRSVKSADDLAATFDELASNATSCSYRLSETVDPEFVSVTVAKKQRTLNNQDDGWQLLSDGRTVSLLGKACTDAKNGGAFTVEVQCNPVIGF